MLALQGRGGDTAVAHLEPGEMVIPRSVLTPQLAQLIAAEVYRRGIDPKQLVVGSRRASINPATGAEEFGFGASLMWDNFKKAVNDPGAYRDLSKIGRAVGLDLAADHLDQFLDKKGDLRVDPSRLQGYPVVRDSDVRIQNNFANEGFVNENSGSAEEREQKRQMKNLEDGQSMRYDSLNFFDGVKGSERAKSAISNPLSGLDAELSLGGFGLGAKGDLNVTRNGNKFDVSGRVDYTVDDPYNFEWPYTPLAKMNDDGRAGNFRTRSSWSRDVIGTVDVDANNVRSNPQLKFGRFYNR
ncbi:MAG: hypothetical protein JNM81_00145 [Rhodospirillaceae bacterium]|nr:hypothetical protein [Rhodospirillaceae bacterium]